MEPDLDPPEILRRLDELEAEVKKLRQKKKDWWDKLSSLSSLFSGIIIGGIGIYATSTYNARQLDAQNLHKGRELVVQRVPNGGKVLSASLIGQRKCP